MEARTIIAGPNGVREDLDDQTTPYLYSDDMLLASLNSAYAEVCFRTRCLKDDTSEACTIALTAGSARYDVAPEVIAVRAAHVSYQKDPLTLCTTGVLDQVEPGWSHMPREGKTEYAVFDASQKKIVLYPAPPENGSLLLRVWRTPNEAEQLDSLDEESIVHLPEPMAVKHWVLYEAYLKKDGEMYDPERANQHLGLFEEQFGPRPSLLAMNLWSTSPACRRTRIQDF